MRSPAPLGKGLQACFSRGSDLLRGRQRHFRENLGRGRIDLRQRVGGRRRAPRPATKFSGRFIVRLVRRNPCADVDQR